MALIEVHRTACHHPEPTVDTNAETDPAAAAAADLRDLVDELRSQTRHADTKVNLGFVAFGVGVAAATTLLPRLAGPALVVGGVGTALLLGAGVPLGLALWARRGNRPRSATVIAATARRHAADPAAAIQERSEEAARLEAIVDRKYSRTNVALVGLGLAVVVLAVAAVLDV